MYVRLGLLVLAGLSIWAQAAPQAGEGIVFVETSRSARGDESTSTIRLLGDRVRFESSSSGEQQVFIFRGDLEVMYLLDVDEQTYQEITRSDLERMGNQMSQMMAQMEEQLRNMPPAQRAMVEQMMRGSMPNMPAAVSEPIVYTRIETGEPVGNWTCDRYEGRQGGSKVQEVCTTDWRDLEISAEDFAVFQQMGEFFGALSSGSDLDLFQVGADPGSEAEGSFPGIPLSRTTFIDGRASSFHQITEVGRQSFESSLFEVPAAFTQTAGPFQVPN